MADRIIRHISEWKPFSDLRPVQQNISSLGYKIEYIEFLHKICYAVSTNSSKGSVGMPTIAPVSDLRNFGNVLEKVTVGSPVYLTRNGRGAYSIRDMKDEENFQKAEAMIRLICELNAGICSAEEEGWISEEDFRSHFRNRRNDKK